VIVASGCSSLILPNAAQLRAISGDTNHVSIKVETIYGKVEIRRNLDAP
jgi:hypothetical protein